MKIINIDNLYIQLSKHLELVEAFLEIKNLAFLIKACRLKPYSYFFGRKTNKLILFDKWFDEYGNSLEIKKKKIRIVYNDLNLDRNKILCTDMYYGLTLNRITKISKIAHLIAGKDEDTYQDCYVVTFLGLDNYFRTYTYVYGEWRQVSPLVLDFKILINITRHYDITYSRKLNIKEKFPLPCLGVQSWLISLPISDSFFSQIKNYKELHEIFNNEIFL